MTCSMVNNWLKKYKKTYIHVYGNIGTRAHKGAFVWVRRCAHNRERLCALYVYMHTTVNACVGRSASRLARSTRAYRALNASQATEHRSSQDAGRPKRRGQIKLYYYYCTETVKKCVCK